MKYHQAMIVDRRDKNDNICNLRITATYFKNESLARERYGESFYMLLAGEDHTIEMLRLNEIEVKNDPRGETTLLSDIEDVKGLQRMVAFLYNRLDDVDTADDMAKDNDKLYRKISQQAQQKKSDCGVFSDGFQLFVKRPTPMPVPSPADSDS